MRFPLVSPILLLVAMAACASAPGARKSCADAPIDAAYLAGGPVYRECEVDRRATPTSGGARADYTPSIRNGCTDAELEFVVDEAGYPVAEPVRIIRTNSPEYAAAMVRVVPTWRYTPAKKDGRPVRQIVRRSVVSKVIVVPAGTSPSPPASSISRCT